MLDVPIIVIKLSVLSLGSGEFTPTKNVPFHGTVGLKSPLPEAVNKFLT